MARLPESHRYHASSMKGACLRPLYFRMAYPEAFDPPSSLNALGGTIGHYLMSCMHEGKEEWCASSKYYSDRIKQICRENQDALFEPSGGNGEATGGGMRLDATGRGTWLDCERAELNAWLEKEADGYGEQLLQYGRWWSVNVDPDPTKYIVGTEVDYTMTIGSKGAPYVVEGFIDLIVQHPIAGLMLLDWKFGTMLRSGLSEFTLGMDYQLCTYALGMRDGTLRIGGETIEKIGKPDLMAFGLMEDLLPYQKRTTISLGKYPTRARSRWVESLLAEGKSVYMPGDLRGPFIHEFAVTDAMLDQHRDEMRARMAATRTGGALVRVRGDHCSWCFWKEICLDEWNAAKRENAGDNRDEH